MHNRVNWPQQAAVALGALVAGAAACAADAVPESIRQCATFTEPARRLACLDAALQQLGVPVAAAPASAVPAVSPAGAAGATAATGATAAAGTTAAAGAAAMPTGPALTPEQKFGATGELKQKQEPKPQEPVLEQLTANIREVRQGASGHYVVTLDNGQVWRQVTPADMMMRPGESVTIKPRTLGSFWLIDASGRGSRFKRIQ